MTRPHTPARELERMRRLRDFPENTCPASRHTARIADDLIRLGRYSMMDEDPEWCGGSIAATVAALWQARSALQRLGYTQRIDSAGRMRWLKEPRQ